MKQIGIVESTVKEEVFGRVERGTHPLWKNGRKEEVQGKRGLRVREIICDEKIEDKFQGLWVSE